MRQTGGHAPPPPPAGDTRHRQPRSPRTPQELPATDSSSPEPVFAQICAAIRREVEVGRLLPGQRLPTTRSLAADLDVAVNTVAKAYHELETEGVVEGRGRQGTFVVDTSGTMRQREVLRFVTTMRNLGVSKEEAQALVERTWAG